MTIADLKRLSEDEARMLIESVIWPHGPTCPTCGNVDQARIRKIVANSAKRIRAGLYVCLECKPKKQFTVTRGTVLEGTHLPLRTWVLIAATICNSKKGCPSRQLQRELKEMTVGGSYGNFQSIWHATMRLRHAMKSTEDDGKLGGEDKIIEADEFWISGDGVKNPSPNQQRKHKRWVPVVVLVERGGGARTKIVENVDAHTLRDHLMKHGDTQSKLMTDEFKGYKWPGKNFASHESVAHKSGEYARGLAFSNTAESFISMVRRAHAVHHKWSVRHFHYYLAEREFIWGTKDVSDVERVKLLLKRTVGKRLYYRTPKCLWQAGQEGSSLLGGSAEAPST